LNPRVQKISDEIDKTKRKITEYQSRLRELERQKTELENADIIALVRSVDIPPDQFAEFARMFKERQGCAVPDLPAAVADTQEKEAEIKENEADGDK
jgi:predicted  nucleic acid-binding Zn-ribbon protein